MRISLFKEFNSNDATLIIVDVQKSFRKFFTEMYINELMKYCKLFQTVYQIWDNHVDGRNIDKDFQYKENPEVPIHKDLYHFPNQKDIIEKRYNYNVKIRFYEKILDKDLLKKIESKESNNQIKKGDIFKTKEDTFLVFTGNKHRWYHIPKKLCTTFQKLKGKEVIIVGGADSECLEDIYISAESLGVKIKRDHRYIYSASHCPIK